MAFAAAQGKPDELLVVTVIITVFPTSPFLGVYVNVNGDVLFEAGFTEPSPFSVIVTFVARPPKVLPLTVTGVVRHVLPLMLLSTTVGPFTHPVTCPNPLIEINKIRLTKRKTLVSLNTIILLLKYPNTSISFTRSVDTIIVP